MLRVGFPAPLYEPRLVPWGLAVTWLGLHVARSGIEGPVEERHCLCTGDVGGLSAAASPEPSTVLLTLGSPLYPMPPLPGVQYEDAVVDIADLPADRRDQR